MAAATRSTDIVDRVLAGAIDMHFHAAPSPFPRRLSSAEAARHYDAAGFRAVVFKSHHHSTVMDVLALEDVLLADLGIEAFGGIALNSHVGGLNPHAVELSLKMGGRIVWFPTLAGRAHIEHQRTSTMRFPSSALRLTDEEQITILDEDGALKREVLEILDLIAEADAILATGHLGAGEILALFDAARERGVRNRLINHPGFILDLSREQTAALVADGATVEHIIGRYDPEIDDSWDIDDLVDWIRLIGPEQTILSSDLGQQANPLPVESYRRVVRGLAERGVTEGELQLMVRDVPARLLGLGAGE